jgi:hypothetical protein
MHQYKPNHVRSLVCSCLCVCVSQVSFTATAVPLEAMDDVLINIGLAPVLLEMLASRFQCCGGGGGDGDVA